MYKTLHVENALTKQNFVSFLFIAALVVLTCDDLGLEFLKLVWSKDSNPYSGRFEWVPETAASHSFFFLSRLSSNSVGFFTLTTPIRVVFL